MNDFGIPVFAFTPAERSRLRQLPALSTDSRGNEVLLGLTLEETVFYIDYGRAWERGEDAFTPQQRDRYLALHRRHEQHRQAALRAGS